MKKLLFFLWILTYLFWNCNPQQSEKKTNDEHANDGIHSHEEESVDDHDESNHEDEHLEEEHDAQFGILEITGRPFFEIIRTSGQILSAQGDEVTLTAAHEGVVVFNSNQLMGGKNVKKNDVLLSISGMTLIHDNIETSYLDVKSNYEKAKRNLERALELNKDKIISDKELLDIKLEYEQANNRFEVIKRNYSGGGQKVSATISGYIKDVFVSEGQFVSTGQPLLKISKNKRLVVKADVPQRYFHMLENIGSANFITVYDKKVYDIKDLNGKLLSYGKTSEGNSLFTSVYFEIDNLGSLLPGVYVEVFLKTVEILNSIVIPKTAVLEESGRYYVYVEGEDGFEKRYIEIDCFDGNNYHIVEGLVFGEHLVTKNPYQIKLSSLSSSLPVHSHNH